MNQHLAALHIRFLPDQAAEDNLSSREFIKKAEFVNVKSLLSSGKEDSEGSEGSEEDENGSQNSQNGGSQNGNGSSENGSQNQSTNYALIGCKPE